MKKFFILVLIVVTLAMFTVEVHASENEGINEGKSKYYKESYENGSYRSINSHWYDKGSYWDGLVRNNTWTYIDILIDTEYKPEFKGMLTRS